MCVTTYLKAMLTDGFLLSVSSRAANYAPHKTIMLHGELSATSPAHHRMAINHLLHRLIYNALLRTRCNVIPHAVRKLTLGHNSRLFYRIVLCTSMINTQGVRCRSYLPFTLKGVVLFLWAGRSRTYEELIFPACPKQVMELKNLLRCQYADDIQSDDKCGKHRNREYGAKEVFFYCFLVGSTEKL